MRKCNGSQIQHVLKNVPEVMGRVTYRNHSARYTPRTEPAWASCGCVCPRWSLCSPCSYCTAPLGCSGSSDCSWGTRWGKASRYREDKWREITEHLMRTDLRKWQGEIGWNAIVLFSLTFQWKGKESMPFGFQCNSTTKKLKNKGRVVNIADC